MADPCPLVEPPNERLKVDDWRLAQLLQAGYGITDASMIAITHEVDLHQAVNLVSQGCPPETATKILL